jgi:glycosyltransferase involved in cell wall biosynthesis
VSQPELTILVPVYNEADNLKKYLGLLSQTAEACTFDYEILFVNDGSTDNSVELILKAKEKNSRIRLAHHRQNLGPGAAIPTGIIHGRGRWLMLVPADLACEPEDLQKLWQARSAADLVVGLRSDRKDYSLWRKFLSTSYIFILTTLTSSEVEQFNYIQMYRKAIFSKIKVESKSVFVTAEIILKAEKAGYRITQVPMRYRPRLAGKASGASLKSISRTLIDMTKYFLSDKD